MALACGYLRLFSGGCVKAVRVGWHDGLLVCEGVPAAVNALRFNHQRAVPIFTYVGDTLTPGTPTQ